MSSPMDDDSAPTPNEDGVDEHGRQIKGLQLAKIIMGTPAGNGGYNFSAWNGRDPSEKFGRVVFILSKLRPEDIYPYITIGDLIRAQKIDLNTDNILIPTECLVGQHIGDRTIGTYLYPPSSMLCSSGNINPQQAQTFLPNLMTAGRILMRVFENPYKNTFWYKFDKGEASNIDSKHHLTPLHKRLQIPSRFIHSTFPQNISDSGFYQPLRKYIPRNPDAQFFSSHRTDGLRNAGIGKPKIPLKPIQGGGKSRRKLKTTNRRTNRRTTKRRNTRTTKRRNTTKIRK